MPSEGCTQCSEDSSSFPARASGESEARAAAVASQSRSRSGSRAEPRAAGPGRGKTTVSLASTTTPAAMLRTGGSADRVAEFLWVPVIRVVTAHPRPPWGSPVRTSGLFIVCVCRGPCRHKPRPFPSPGGRSFITPEGLPTAAALPGYGPLHPVVNVQSASHQWATPCPLPTAGCTRTLERGRGPGHGSGCPAAD